MTLCQSSVISLKYRLISQYFLARYSQEDEMVNLFSFAFLLVKLDLTTKHHGT